MGRNKLSVDNQVRKLRQQIREMVHYWKIRCKERKTLTATMKKYQSLLLGIEKQHKLLANLLLRKKGFIQQTNARKKSLYPLFLAENEILRLRAYLSYPLYARYVRKEHGKNVPQLTHSELSKLHWILRKRTPTPKKG